MVKRLKNIEFFNHEICVGARLTQTRYAQRARVEMEENMDEQNYENGQFNQNESQPTGNVQQGGGNYQDYTNMQYQAPYDYNSGDSDKANGMQIASLVLGIIGIPACCCYGVPGVLFGIIGLILAIVGNKRSRNKGIGIAGLVCSIIAIVFGAIVSVYYIYVLQAFGPLIQRVMNGEITYEEMMQELMQEYGTY